MIQKAGANQAHNWQPGQNQRENGNQKVSITIQNTPVPGKTGILQICKLYNYDELNIGSGTLKIPYTGNNDYNLVSSLVGGYVGKTVIFDDAELRLENTYGFKSMGSLVRQTNADATKQAKLYFNGARVYAGLNYKNNQHPFLIRLTDEDPFGIDHGMPERKIRVYGESEDAELIVFNLTGVKQDKYVTVKGVKSGFTWRNFYPKYEDHTIRMEDAYTMVTDPAGNRTKYRDIAGAITAVADMEKARKEQGQLDWAGNKYMISFFRDEYVMNWKDTVTQERRAHADEVEAMKSAGKGDRAFTYLGEEYTDLPETLKDAVITWDAKRNEAGNVTKEYIEIYVAGDLNFFGTSTTLDGLYLDYSGHSNMDPMTSRDIYANGSDLTITRDNCIIYIGDAVDYTKLYPSFYGGTGKTVETNTKKGGNITILPYDGEINFYDLKDFTNLIVGDGRDDDIGVSGSITVYGQLNDKLTTGKNETAGGNGGTLYFNGAYISLSGYQECYVTNVRVSDNSNNMLLLSKDKETYPLHVAEKLTMDNEKAETDDTLSYRRLMIQLTSFSAEHGDVLIEFTKEENAKERQYQDGYGGYNNIVLKKYRRFILFGDRTKTFEQIYLYETAEGEALDDNINLIGKYRTYAEAFEEVGTRDADKIYTFKNVVSVDFTQDDQDELLRAVSRDKAAGLILESGYRGDGNTDGAAGTRYRVRMRIQTLQLPEGVDVTFRDIVMMKYDQGRNSELTKEADGNTVNVQDMVFAGNGGALTFGNGVVFLQHKDAPMYPTVYGGSITRALNMDAAVTIQSGTFASIYGAGIAEQTGNVSVQMSGGSVENLFGGGRTAAGKLTGSTQVTVSGGAIRGRNIYGGGDGAEVTGNTNIHITAAVRTTEGNRKSVYGGGAVTTSLADNVKGTVKSISIKTQDKTKRGDASVKNLSGFTELSIGHEEELNGNFNYSHVTVTERFDSRPVGDSADLTVKDRTDMVKLNYSGLILGGDYQGHIGSLKTKGETVIYIYKKKADTNDTRPLILDGTVTLTTADSIKLRSTITNTYEDKMLVFTTEANAELTQEVGAVTVAKYKDGEKNMNVSNLTENNLGYIIFQTPPAHTVESCVTYAPENNVILDDSQADDGSTLNPKKVLHFEYDRQNKHPVDKAYVIAMPKTVAVEAGKDGATAYAKIAAERYTKMDTGYATNGTFSDTGFYKTSGNDQNVWTVTWTKDQNKDNYAGGTTGDNNPITVDEKNYWYILHVVCENGEYYSELVDVDAPEKVRTEVETRFDSATGKYTFTL